MSQEKLTNRDIKEKNIRNNNDGKELSESHGKGIVYLFYKAGEFLYKILFGSAKRHGSYYGKIYDAERTLDPSAKPEKKVEKFLAEKIGIILAVGLIGSIFSLLYFFFGREDGLLDDNNRLQRQAHGGKQYEVVLDVDMDGEHIDNYEIVVNPTAYSEEELKTLSESFFPDFEESFLGENESLDYINRPVHFPEGIAGYPFKLEYDWDDKEIIDRKGNIGESVPSEGTVINIELTASYEEYNEIYEFAVRVFPMNYTKMEYLTQLIENALMEKDTETKESEYYTLPSEIEGIKVVWQEEKKNNVVIFVAMTIIACIGIFYGKDRDLYKKAQDKGIQMMEDYPEIVSKFTLYIGAGMTVRGAWKKIATDYRENAGASVRYAYEEMLFTLYEMENGTEETVCYNHFSQRVKVQKYVKFVALLDQNNRKGSNNLISSLREESAEAFEERKSLAEKKGEEAGTKLLIPMLLMLMVVMVVIMVPAFMSM